MSTNILKKWGRANGLRSFMLVLFSGCFLSQSCSKKDKTAAENSPDRLSICDSDQQCGELQCICGVCLKSCTSNAECDVKGLDMRCIQLSDVSEIIGCNTADLVDGACLQICVRDADCLDQQSCVAGGCVPNPEEQAVEQEPETNLDASAPIVDASVGEEMDAAVDADVLPKEPLSNCISSEWSVDRSVYQVNKVDLLFMVDNSHSMAQEQAKLREQLPRLIKVLTTGDKNPDDGIDTEDFVPVRDLHLAVVTSDMGSPGIPPEQNFPSGDCYGTGNDGLFMHSSAFAIDAGLTCYDAYPLFLEHQIDFSDDSDELLQKAQETADDFACITAVGVDGCGFEMPLESVLKSLWPSLDENLTSEHQALNIQFLAGSQGRGDRDHIEFLRGTDYHPTQSDPLSILAILVVTDEDDCSAGANGNLDFLSLDYTGNRRDANLRCYFDGLNNWGNRYPVDRYINGFKTLRPGTAFKDLVLFSAIAGIPQDLVEDINGDGEITAVERDNFYSSIFNHPKMQETENAEGLNLLNSCVQDDDSDGEMETDAYPPIRLTQVAQGFGENGSIHSICNSSFSPAIDNLIDNISNKLLGLCLAQEFDRDADGEIACELTFKMPSGETCDDYAYLTSPPSDRPQTENGRDLCLVRQVSVVDPDADSPQDALAKDSKSGDVLTGWYYDDFLSERETRCPKGTNGESQRISFVLDQIDLELSDEPIPGASIELSCSHQEEILSKIGLSCDSDDDCEPYPLFCHKQAQVCVVRCETDEDCVEGQGFSQWVCNAEDRTIEEAGHPICVLPACEEVHFTF